jgi:DNA primase
MARQRKQQEKIDLAPVKALQPKDRSIRYDNMRSARAEESIIAQILREPALLEQTGKLKQSDFSVELLGRVYGQLRSRYENGLEVSLGVLADLTPQEMSHVTMISQKQQGPVNENALRDCVDTVMAERQSANISTDDDLLALRNKLKESKGTKI